MWNDLSPIWQEAFKQAWESYKRDTIPIGAVIVDSNGNIVAVGRNQIFDIRSTNLLAGTYMAHAEMTAMMQLKDNDHPEVNTYSLYTTMEPCPMCFGTMVMMGIRNLHYAARDGFAGATEINDKLDYIKSKNIKIVKEDREMEAFQIILHSSFEYKRKHRKLELIMDSWRSYCPIGVSLGKRLYEEDYFSDVISKNKDISLIYDEVVNRYNSKINIMRR